VLLGLFRDVGVLERCLVAAYRTGNGLAAEARGGEIIIEREPLRARGRM